jgi:outer membrane protein, multidrug efflux system
MKIRLLTTLLYYSLIIIVISSCSLYTKPKVPNLSVPASFKNANKFTYSALKNRWWENFNDYKLNQLVNLALKNNLNYQLALKNIAIARTYVTENASSLFPQANINLAQTRNATSRNASTMPPNIRTDSLYNLYQLNGSVSYEVDVWSRIRNSIMQAITNVKINQADSEVIKLSLISSIIDSYWQLVALNSNLENLKQQYNITCEIASLTQDKYKTGLVNINPISDTKIQIENIKNNIASLEKKRQTLQNTLAYLVGTYPENFNFIIGKDLATSQKNLTKIVPSGIPAQVLSNRPDIQNAFYQVISYGYIQKQTIASFLPTFMLTGTYGFASLSLGNFTAGGSTLWNLGVNATEILFDAAKRFSQYKRAKLQYEAAILRYKNTVINAFTEVDNALIYYQQDYLALATARNITNFSKEKLEAANAQYRSGVISYLSYLEYKLIFLQNNFALTTQTQVLLTDIIQVYKTLGLGFNI